MNRFLLLNMGLYFAFQVNAQVDEFDSRESLVFGVKSGINYSNVYDSETEDFRADGQVGFVGGVMLAIPLGQYFGLQPEVLLSQKGFKGESDFLGVNYSFSRRTTFIDVPLLVSIKPIKFLSIVAGPQFSYLLRQKDVFNSPFIDGAHEESYENENIRKNILGAVVGVDVTINQFVFASRLAWDLSSNHGDGTSSTPNYKNTWFQATLGYNF